MSLVFCLSAMAQSKRGKVTLQMSNEDNEGTLTCKVYKVHRSTKKQTYFKKFTSRTAPCSSSVQWKSPMWRRNNE